MKIYVVGLHLSRKILAGYLGFSDYVTCFVQAKTNLEAEAKAIEHYSNKYQLTVEKTEIWEALEQNIDTYSNSDNLIN